MSDDVTIPFRSRIEVGDSMFVVPIQRKFADQHNRRFGFESITLMPEYQNTQAYAYQLDPKSELESVLEYPLQLEVTYGPNYYVKDATSRVAWTHMGGLHQSMNVALETINYYFDRNKPAGTFLPPVFFDWFHLEALDEEETIRGYAESTAQQAYGEEFDPAKHATWLPPSLQKFDKFNNCIFPTSKNAEYLADVRLRMWVAPNTTITFSNNSLLTAMGFLLTQIPEKTGRGQIPYVNTDVTNYAMFSPYDAPVSVLPVTEVRGSKINCYVTNPTVLSPIRYLKTTREREKNPTHLYEDYARSIESLGRLMNVYTTLEFNKAGNKKFAFKFPTNPNITVRVSLPASVMRQLGFDPANGEWIDQRSVAIPVSTTIDTENLEQKALALVYDTGMVAVDLYQQTSQLSSHSGNTLMATLHPKKDGTLRNRIYFGDMPRVYVTSANPDLKFAVYRFDDNNVKHKLGWPVGAYVFGSLTGKV
jgi:hypothetical protein